MNNYGLQVVKGAVSEPHLWNFSTLCEAQIAAKNIAEKHNVDVMVFQIIGTYKITTSWEARSFEDG